MPSGRTHDSITLWSLPLIAAATYERTRSPSLTLVLSGGYLFSGLMFGPDLDIHSCQYKRWGVLRWIWLPYRHSMRHRAFLSHGPIIGTIVRLVYLLSWVAMGLGGAILISAIAYSVIGEAETWTQFAQLWWSTGWNVLGRSLRQHYPQWLALLLGLELGAMSHSLSDWVSSRYPRRRSKSKPAAARAVARPPKPASPTVELPSLPQRDSDRG